jgi:hypothetical protein
MDYNQTPVDVVILWCQDDFQHRRIRNQVLKQKTTSSGDTSFTRFRDNGEIQFCLACIVRFMTWVNKIHVVVADYQVNNIDHVLKNSNGNADVYNDKVRVVRHSDILPSTSLPTFNSQAIEACLNYIPCLSDRFVYFNDDFFIGRAIDKNFFFDGPQMLPCYYLDNSLCPSLPRSRTYSMHANAWCNNQIVLDTLFHPSPSGSRRYPAHVAVPMLKSSWDSIAELAFVQKLLHGTVNSRFRQKNNIYMIGLLIYYHIYTNKTHVIRKSGDDALFIDLSKGDATNHIFTDLLAIRPALFCVNDNGYNEKQKKIFHRAMHILLQPNHTKEQLR